MKAFLIAITTTLTISALYGCTSSSINVPPALANGWTTPPARKTMRAFRSEQELANYLRELAEKQKHDRTRMEAQQAPPAKIATDSSVAKEKTSDDKDESVTNVQHAGVDEGGIVKLHGDHLVVLRRGRLFTVKIGDGALRPISSVDAFGPDINPRGTWYDEMLVSEDTIAVIGYSYERGGTEVGLFRIDREATSVTAPPITSAQMIITRRATTRAD